MATETRSPTLCLSHQRIEDQMSPLGLVCPRCKQRLYANLPSGPCRSFWESQPVAYSLDGEPCFVYTLWWDDYRIRSLHPPDSQTDPRGARIRAANKRQQAASSEFDWHNNIRLERGLMNDPEFDAEEWGVAGMPPRRRAEYG